MQPEIIYRFSTVETIESKDASYHLTAPFPGKQNQDKC